MDTDSQATAASQSSKTKVQVVYDNINGTWNTMTLDRQCLFYGTVLELEQWLIDNSETHYESET